MAFLVLNIGDLIAQPSQEILVDGQDPILVEGNEPANTFTDETGHTYCINNIIELSELITHTIENNQGLIILGFDLWDCRILRQISPLLHLAEDVREKFENSVFCSLQADAEMTELPIDTILNCSDAWRLSASIRLAPFWNEKNYVLLTTDVREFELLDEKVTPIALNLLDTQAYEIAQRTLDLIMNEEIENLERPSFFEQRPAKRARTEDHDHTYQP